MRRRRQAAPLGARAALIGFAALAAAAIPTGRSDAAEPDRPLAFKARLGVFYGGFLIYSGSLKGTVGGGRYELNYAAQTRGLLRLVYAMKTRNEVVGVLRNGRLRALTYRNQVLRRSRRDAIEITFGPDGAERTVATPPFAARNRRAIPVEVSRGALDPLTSLLAGMAGGGGKAPCSWKRRIYDGRQLNRVEFENLGADHLSNDGLTLYSGPAVKCRLRLVLLADTRREPRKREKKRDGRDEPIIWLARLKPQGIWLPVRARGWSRVGAVTAGLVDLKISRNGAVAK